MQKIFNIHKLLDHGNAKAPHKDKSGTKEVKIRVIKCPTGPLFLDSL